MTPGATLYYLAHVLTVDVPPLGSWSDTGNLIGCGAGFVHNFDEARPEVGLDHFRANVFVDQDRRALSELASRNGGTVQVNSPFGTLFYAKYLLSAGPWPDVLHGEATWDVLTDGVHVLASLRLPGADPSALQGSPFPHELYDRLRAHFADWTFEIEQLILGLDWHPVPASQFPLAGQVFRVQDLPMIATKSVYVGTTLHRYVGQNASRYLPLYFGDYLGLSVRTKRLTAMLNVAMNARVNNDDLAVPDQLGNFQDRQAQKRQLTHVWNETLRLKQQFDDQDDLIDTGQAWVTALQALKEHGFYRKPTGGFILHGPFHALLMRDAHEYTLRAKEIPYLSESTLSTKNLERTLRNAERYRQRLDRRSTTVKDGLDVQSSLLSLKSSDQSLKTATNSFWAGIAGLIVALVALAIAIGGGLRKLLRSAK